MLTVIKQSSKTFHGAKWFETLKPNCQNLQLKDQGVSFTKGCKQQIGIKCIEVDTF